MIQQNNKWIFTIVLCFNLGASYDLFAAANEAVPTSSQTMAKRPFPTKAELDKFGTLQTSCTDIVQNSYNLAISNAIISNAEEINPDPNYPHQNDPWKIYPAIMSHFSRLGREFGIYQTKSINDLVTTPEKQLKFTKFLLEAGYKPHFCELAFTKHPAVMQLLVQSGVNALDRYSGGSSALIHHLNNPDTFQILINAKVKPTSKDLYYAAETGSVAYKDHSEHSHSDEFKAQNITKLIIHGACPNTPPAHPYGQPNLIDSCANNPTLTAAIHKGLAIRNMPEHEKMGLEDFMPKKREQREKAFTQARQVVPWKPTFTPQPMQLTPLQQYQKEQWLAAGRKTCYRRP